MDQHLFTGLKTENLIQKDGILLSEENNESVSYDEASRSAHFKLEDTSYWFRHRNSVILSAIQSAGFSEGTFIDAGGGNGHITKMLQDEGYDVTLFEPGLEGALNAKVRGVKNIVCSFLNDTVVTKKSVSAIGLFDVIEHIEDDERFLSELRELLNDDGYLFITVPAHQKLWSESDVIAGHFRRYSKEQLISLLLDSGYSVINTSFFFRYLSLPIYLFRALPYKMGLSKRQAGEAKPSEFLPPQALNNLVMSFFSSEARTILNGGTVTHGASLIISARKTPLENKH